jgi:serine/threonine protein kinase
MFQYPREFVDFYGWYENKDNVFLSMEYFQYGDLDKYIAAGFSEQETKSITIQLLEGLALMHANHFTHRDLKPQVSHSHIFPRLKWRWSSR